MAYSVNRTFCGPKNLQSSANKKKTAQNPQSRCSRIIWVVPPPSNSHHQDYYIFSRGSQPKPSFATGILGGGTTQRIIIILPPGHPWLIYVHFFMSTVLFLPTASLATPRVLLFFVKTCSASVASHGVGSGGVGWGC